VLAAYEAQEGALVAAEHSIDQVRIVPELLPEHGHINRPLRLQHVRY
jgi:hypothetical protein